jgi:hypothetical protein
MRIFSLATFLFLFLSLSLFLASSTREKREEEDEEKFKKSHSGKADTRLFHRSNQVTSSLKSIEIKDEK